MTGFLGSYLHQLDEKGRLALPAPFRRSSEGGGFVLIHCYETALFLYPATAWAKMEEELGELLRRKPDARGFVLSVTANAVEVVPDNQGRILIPERLQRAAELEREVLVVGALHKIEIWNPHHFDRATAEAKPEFEQFVRQIII